MVLTTNGLLAGRVGLVAGLSDRHGVAWGVTQVLTEAGARLAFSYQQRFARHAHELTEAIPGKLLVHVEDAADDASLRPAFESMQREFGGLDFLVHSIAYAPPDAMMGRFTDTTRDAWRIAMEASAYSLLAMARAAEALFQQRGGGSIVTLTYYGGEKAVLGYKIMGVAKSALDSIVRYLAAELGPQGIRVNAISAGPMRTLAARGIPGFTDMFQGVREKAPLRRNIDTRDVGNAVLYLVSELGRNVTGDILHVDAGYHAVGV
jgi:enoyl-[acyl-carrier protein] reductase I